MLLCSTATEGEGCRRTRSRLGGLERGGKEGGVKRKMEGETGERDPFLFNS